MPDLAWTPRFDPITYRPPRLTGGRARGPGLGEAATDKTPEQVVEPMKLITQAVRVEGDSDSLVRKKVQLLRDFVVAPALATGTMGMAFTRGLLTEALGRAPKDITSHQKSALAVRLFEFVRTRIRYINDPAGQEYFQSVPGIWKSQMGDCEDFTALLAALFTAAGIKVRARVIRVPNAEGWAHIYLMAFLDGAWRAFDATEKWPAGWQFPKRTAEMDLPIAPELN
ncbi:MAG TPA: transglutaminase domain-containing protein [Geothrix sp.]|nr:transglutaminase domain-containing protein [Geothrix sp.]HJV47723.1 transglutaminase domain-containing protein [Geothrix sp.]